MRSDKPMENGIFSAEPLIFDNMWVWGERDFKFSKRKSPTLQQENRRISTKPLEQAFKLLCFK